MYRNHKLITLCLLALPTLVFSGCGSDKKSADNKPASSTAASSTTTAETTSPAESSGGTTVTMENIQFSPKELKIKVGDTLTWENKDSVPHNVIANSGATFSSKDFGQGESFTWTAKKAGEVSYECTLHPGMEAKITVTN